MADFTGHQLVLINGGWMFDITEFKGYKVELNSDNQLVRSNLAFIVKEMDNDIEEGDRENQYYFLKNMQIPLSVLQTALRVILNYNTKVKGEAYGFV